jgi:exonuclease III
MANFKIASCNSQGLSDFQKRRDVFQHLRQLKFDAYFIQDSHFKPSLEKQIRSEWGYESYFASNSSQSRGVAILFNNTFDFKIQKIIRDPNGNFLILNLTTMNHDLTLVNIYGPNKDNPTFYEQIQNLLQDMDKTHIIMAGDWNLVLDPTKDYYNYKHNNNPKAQDKVLEMSVDLQLIDVWREINPEVHRYTWRRTNPHQQARLDFYLVSESLLSYVKHADIVYGYRSDHSLITLEIKFAQETRHTGSWKFNASLLKDQDYVQLVHNVIEETIAQYAVLVYNRQDLDKIPLDQIQFTISDQLFLDTLLMHIRSKSMEFSSKKKRETNAQEHKLMDEINKLEQTLNRTEDDNIELQQKIISLTELRKTKMDGILLRSKARWAAKGEKISKYYCNLEKRHYVSKQMFKLVTNDGSCLDRTEEMLIETKQYFENLYSERLVPEIDLREFSHTLPKLTDMEAEQLEGLITLEEASSALKNMTNGKSPGSDGITVDFLKFFWKKLGTFVVRSLNEGLQRGEMSISQKEGLIICIPKGDKPREFLKNWRPISLLNVTYKIGSSCIANRIKKVLHSLIHEDQTGFLAGRYIGDNLRLIYDIIHHLNTTNKPGLLISIDFEKAFDSVSWKYMKNVLQEFGFKESIIRWISAFYNDIKSSVTVNGMTSRQFNVRRGCRQGDPISPYLFILCAEVLACKIREDEEIKGIKISDVEFKITQFADDTSLLQNGDKRSYDKLFTILESFEKISGLKLNYDKTVNVWLGNKRNSKVTFADHIKMEWNPIKFKILGLWFTNDLKGMADLNYTEKMRETKILFKTWLKRTSTPLGRVAVLKSLILSKLIYLWLMLPNPPDDLIKELQLLCFEFIWDKKHDKIKRTTVIRNVEQGGLGVPYIKAFISALKLTWVKKLYRDKPKWYHILATDNPEIELVHKIGPQFICNKITNAFWKDAFNGFREFFNRTSVTEYQEILQEPIFCNNKFKQDKETFYYRQWVEKKIYLVKDLTNHAGEFLTFEEFQTKFNIETNFLKYYSCISSIKQYITTNTIQKDTTTRLNATKAFTLMTRSPKGTKIFYNTFVQKTELPNPCKNWDLKLGRKIDWDQVFKMTKRISEVRLKWFQIKIMYRILVNNVMLQEMGVLTSSNCSFCYQSRDSVYHYLWECVHVQQFWNEFERHLKNVCIHCDRLKLKDSLVLFGWEENVKTDAVFDFILLSAKFFVYKCRYNKTKPLLRIFLQELKYRYRVEEYCHKINMNSLQFLQNWLPYRELLT